VESPPKWCTVALICLPCVHVQGSGEYALRHLLAPGAWAHEPLTRRLQDLKVGVFVVKAKPGQARNGRQHTVSRSVPWYIVLVLKPTGTSGDTGSPECGPCLLADKRGGQEGPLVIRRGTT
jgi:hypothetical protein